MIEIKEIYAQDKYELKEKLNEIKGRIISITHRYDNTYEIIYETNS